MASPEIFFRAGCLPPMRTSCWKPAAGALANVGDGRCRWRTARDQSRRAPGRCRQSARAELAYFKTFKSNPQSTVTLAEPVRSYFTGNWITVIAHRLNGPDGVFLGVMARRIDPAYLGETFFASMALGKGRVDRMVHRDGIQTMLAHYPHNPAVIGQKSQEWRRCWSKIPSEGGRQTLRMQAPSITRTGSVRPPS